MATSTCPEGHESDADDWCDVCGAQIGGASSGSADGDPADNDGADRDSGESPSAPQSGSMLDIDSPAPDVAATQTCANCQTVSAGSALFCESCGYDFTTGQLPAPVAATGGLDPELDGPFAGQDAGQGAAAASPVGDPPTEVEWVAEIWIDPDWYASQGSADADPCPTSGPPSVVPLPGPTALIGRRSQSRNIHPAIDCGSDSSVSRRQAELIRDGHRWFLEDLGSTNGSFAGPARGPLPIDPIEPGTRHELGENDRVYVGAWTRIVVRPATGSERRP